MMKTEKSNQGWDEMKRVLIVDDDQGICDFIAEVVESAGYQAAHANNSHEMIRVLEGGLPDLMIIDLIMPDRDGVECLEMMARMEGFASLPILMMSGFDKTMLAIAQKFGSERGLNMVGVLNKPFSVSGLRDRIDQAFACDAASSRLGTTADAPAFRSVS
ncbi:response regulator [bacterium SCSIO 12827]|nr:response regulator [bacterium SCSIO 12827]